MSHHPLEHIFDDDFVGEVQGASPADFARAARHHLWLRRKRIFVALLALLMVAIVAVAMQARGHGYKTRLMHRLFPHSMTWMAHPAVATVRPGIGAGNVAPDSFISVDVRLPNGGEVVDAATVSSGAVKLYRSEDRQPVAASVNTTAAGDAVVVRPARPLDVNTSYTFEVLPALKDTGGASFVPFRSRFTTSASRQAETYPVAFEKVALPQTEGHRFTCVTVGPDRLLYASTADGWILRYSISEDGSLGRGQTVLSPEITGSPRLVTGLCFDPTCTADRLILWISHGQAAERTASDWTGKISRLSGPTLSRYEDVIVGLPRSTRDHLTNQMNFGPDGALYVAQAGNTAMGAPDRGWGMRAERLLGAAILRVDTRAILNLPLDVRTDDGGHYDPFAPGAPVTLYATGLRNAFDMVWHRNGHLYAPSNGSSAGGNTPGFAPGKGSRSRRIDEPVGLADGLPAVEALPDLRLTEQDMLADVEPGGYYGHPNPARGEFVLNGGNPAAKAGPFEIPQYPVGTLPDRNWRRPVFDFGKHLAPCGLIEYRGRAFNGLLDGKILVTRFSGGKDVIVLAPDPATGGIVEAVTGIAGLNGFSGPVDLCEDHPTGCLYVAEYEGQRLTLVRPVPGGVSDRVFRQAPRPLAISSSGPPALMVQSDAD